MPLGRKRVGITSADVNPCVLQRVSYLYASLYLLSCGGGWILTRILTNPGIVPQPRLGYLAGGRCGSCR